MWATRPLLASIYEKLLDQKTFGCLRLIVCSQYYLAKTLTTTEKCSIIQVSSLLPRKKGFLSFMKLFRELYHYREMLFSLVRKDLRGRYKGSVLGFLWTFINPLMQLLVYTFVFTVILPAHGGVVRKARAFRGGANKTALPCETLAIICYLAIVPVEQLQRKFLTENLCS
jgi:hypothetical protein